MWDARLWETLGFALLLPLLLEWEMEAVAWKKVGRSSCCGAGQAPQLPNPGAHSRVGQSSGAGAYTLGLVPENHLHICLQLLCPPWICPPKAVWGDASVLLPSRTFSPLLGRDDTSPGNLPSSRLAGEGQPLAGALGLACWGLGKGLQQLGGHRAEPTKHSLEPLCRALLSWKSCVQSSPALQLWLQGRNVTCPAAAAVGGAWAPMALGHDLTRGLRREMGV